MIGGMRDLGSDAEEFMVAVIRAEFAAAVAVLR